jgi:uncharacterized membrane protein YdjX (TVP38/TMEM64 family)
MTITNKKKRPYLPHDYITPDTPPPSHQPTLSPSWIVATILLIAGIITAIWLARQPLEELFLLLSDQEKVSSYLQGFGVWGPMVLAFLQFLQVIIVIIPGHVFLIAAGYVYGFPLGFALNFIYVVTASQLAFGLSRWAGRPLVERLVRQELLDRWYKLGQERGFLFFTAAFLLPVFPTDLMNFVAGLTGISGRRFLAANLLGRLPSVIMLTLIGSHGLEFSQFTWVLIGVFVASLYAIGRFTISKLEVRRQPKVD